MVYRLHRMFSKYFYDSAYSTKKTWWSHFVYSLKYCRFYKKFQGVVFFFTDVSITHFPLPFRIIYETPTLILLKPHFISNQSRACFYLSLFLACACIPPKQTYEYMNKIFNNAERTEV